MDLVVTDYRDVEGSFDRIASFGMFEHVGPKNYEAYFAAEAGRAAFLFHSFGSVRPTPTLRQPEVGWVENTSFPGRAPSLVFTDRRRLRGIIPRCWPGGTTSFAAGTTFAAAYDEAFFRK